MTDHYHFTKSIGGGLMPIDCVAEDMMRSVSPGCVLRVSIKKDRNPGHHRKFFGILNLVFKNQDKYLSVDALRFAVMVSAGYVDQIRLEGDAVTLRPVSISWAKMDQIEFDKLYSACLAAIPRLLPQFDGVDLDMELQMATVGV